jgi:FKBP-type peptidyl-prolyl cis-trans isomerase FklB
MSMKRIAVIVLLGASVWTGAWAADVPVQSGSDADKANYSVGYQLGSDIEALQRLGMDPSLAAILKGMSDALAGSPPSISAAEMSKTLADLRQAKQQRPSRTSFQENQTRAFTALNAKREGVVTLPNGLQYKVVKAGSGRQPQASDTVTINYKASLASQP